MAELNGGVELDDWQKQWAENMKNPVPLHPELEEHLVRADLGSKFKWDALKHPLVFGVPYTPGMNFLYNKQLEAKTKALQEYISEENWSGYVFMHERPYRFNAFEEICSKLDGPKYWDLLSAIWSDSENLWQIGYRQIKKALSFYPEHRDHFMDEREKVFLQSLPDQIRVFRGHQRWNQKGFSWTLAYNIAVWFGNRYALPGYDNKVKVSEGVVRKSDIVGLVFGRNEMEVVVDPRHLSGLKVMQPISRSEELAQLKRELVSQFQLRGRTDHGPDHWDKVHRNGVELCQLVPSADRAVVGLFAIFHDSQRKDERSDSKHGHRAADMVTLMYKNGMIQGITDEQFTKLEYACRHHNGGKPVSDPTIGVCFDADRLDLLRVGIIPDPKLLSTEAARGLIGVI